VTQKDYKQETDKIETSIASGVTKDESYITHFQNRKRSAKGIKTKDHVGNDQQLFENKRNPAANTEIFGVFKDGSCGTYRELDITMDCETIILQALHMVIPELHR
jgi:hypothetical protein